MNTDNDKTFFRQKGFYISLLVGVVALLAVWIISSSMFTGKEKGQQIADDNNLNNMSASIAKEDAAGAGTTSAAQESAERMAKAKQEQLASVEQTSSKNTKDIAKEDTKKTSSKNKDKKAQGTQEAKQEDIAKPVSNTGDTVKNLSFNEEKGLLWPISGDVLMPYSMDKTIYFKTLAQYKCNPALLISGKEDMEVMSSCNSVITDIEEDAETGLTVTASIGNGYEVVYGNLKDVAWQIGDYIKEGAVIGKLAAPTKYYVEEGTNLYFKVMEKEEAVDPMLLLR